MKLIIPWECLASANERNTRLGGRGHSWDYKLALKRIHLEAIKQVPQPHPHFTEAPLWYRMEFYPPDGRRRDCGNFLKALEDAFTGVVWADDWLVRDVGYLVHPVDGSEPRVEIRIGTGFHRED